MRAIALALLAACTCPDTHHEQKPFADRTMYGAEIDACLASSASCEQLCRDVLALDPRYAITKCEITSTTASGAQLDVAYYDSSACLG